MLQALIGPVAGLLDKFIEDKDASSMFVAGWRPAVGWVCVLGMASNFIVIPMANFGLALAESGIVIPLIETSTMMPVLMGMLGLGAMRSVEKVQKVSREK